MSVIAISAAAIGWGAGGFVLVVLGAMAMLALRKSYLSFDERWEADKAKLLDTQDYDVDELVEMKRASMAEKDRRS